MILNHIVRLIWALAISVSAIGVMQAQELLVKAQVLAPSIQQTDPKVFQAMKLSIEEFMNSTKWTDDEWLPEERIQVSITINITKELGPNNFEGEFNIQSTRPVYGSTYQSPIFNHQDRDFNIEYQMAQPMIYTRNAPNPNFISILAYYAYMVIGFDYNSFSLNGGMPYFRQAWDIVLTMNNAPGWNADKSLRNRYWLAENMLSTRSGDYHKGFYTYHRLGLDLASSNIEQCQAKMIEGLFDIEKANQAYFQSMMVQVFMQTKNNEIIEVFKPSKPDQKNTVLAIIPKLDPANASKYRAQMGG